MKPKLRTIKRQRAKGLGGRAKTGQKVPIYSRERARGASSDSASVPTRTSKAILVPLRVAIPTGVKDDLESIVVDLGLYANVSELARTVLLKERDRRMGELRRAKAAEKEAEP